jgi:hypothetical protein
LVIADLLVHSIHRNPTEAASIIDLEAKRELATTPLKLESSGNLNTIRQSQLHAFPGELGERRGCPSVAIGKHESLLYLAQ